MKTVGRTNECWIQHETKEVFCMYTKNIVEEVRGKISRNKVIAKSRGWLPTVVAVAHSLQEALTWKKTSANGVLKLGGGSVRGYPCSCLCWGVSAQWEP